MQEVSDELSDECKCGDFSLAPAETARAQRAFHQLSQNPAAAMLFGLIEDYREQMIWQQAQRALFRRDYRSGREKEIERRALEAEATGRQYWQLEMKEEAEAAWRRAEKLWTALDRIQEDQEIRLAAMKRLANKKRGRRAA